MYSYTLRSNIHKKVSISVTLFNPLNYHKYIQEVKLNIFNGITTVITSLISNINAHQLAIHQELPCTALYST